MGGTTRTTRPRPPVRRPRAPGLPGRRPPYRRRPWLYRGRRPWRRGRWGGGWWAYPSAWAYPDEIPAAPGVAAPDTAAGLEQFSPAARASLRRLGLLRGVWPRRLATAPPSLVRFVNRFHRVAGVEEVVRDLYAGGDRQARARLAMRLARRIADRFPDSQQTISFQRSLGMASGGDVIPAVELIDERSGLRYLFKPWRRLDPRRIVAHFLRDVRLHGRSPKVRWVFDGRTLGMAKTDVVRAVRRALAHPAFTPRGHPLLRPWLERLEQIVVVVDPQQREAEWWPEADYASGGSGKTKPIRRRRRREVPVSDPGIPGGDNRWFPSQGEARNAALQAANSQGLGYGIAHDPRPSRGLPHYHVVDSAGRRVSGHFFYGRRQPRRVLRKKLKR